MSDDEPTMQILPESEQVVLESNEANNNIEVEKVEKDSPLFALLNKVEKDGYVQESISKGRIGEGRYITFDQGTYVKKFSNGSNTFSGSAISIWFMQIKQWAQKGHTLSLLQCQSEGEQLFGATASVEHWPH